MAAVAFLHPQDAFHQNPALKSRRRFYDPTTPFTNSPAAVNGGRRSPNSKRRKGSPTKKDAAPVNPKPRSTPKPTPTTTNLAPVMGQVKILKRGEALPQSPAPAPEKVNQVAAAAAVDVAVDVLVTQAPAKAPLVTHKSLEKTPAKAPLVSHKSLEKTPVKFQKHLKFQYAFAGSATATSPEPNCVPLPSFCSKSSAIDDPSKQLCRLLGLAL